MSETTVDSADTPTTPEPPEGAFVLLDAYYGVYEHAERGWIDTFSARGGRALGYDTLVRLNSGKPPVRLYREDDAAIALAALFCAAREAGSRG